MYMMIKKLMKKYRKILNLILSTAAGEAIDDEPDSEESVSSPEFEYLTDMSDA